MRLPTNKARRRWYRYVHKLEIGGGAVIIEAGMPVRVVTSVAKGATGRVTHVFSDAYRVVPDDDGLGIIWGAEADLEQLTEGTPHG